MRYTKALLFLWMFLFISCNGERGVVGGESNVEEGPVLIDATLSLEIVDGQPAKVTDYFYIDDTVNVYTLWEDVPDTETVYFYFVDPDGDVRDSLNLPLYPHKFSTCIASYIPYSDEGDWEVLIFLNNTFKRSLLFTLASSLDDTSKQINKE